MLPEEIIKEAHFTYITNMSDKNVYDIKIVSSYLMF